MRGKHTIIISDEPFGCGFDVQIIPTPKGTDYNREFFEIGDARHYSSRLSAAIGWRVIDASCAVAETSA